MFMKIISKNFIVCGTEDQLVSHQVGQRYVDVLNKPAKQLSIFRLKERVTLFSTGSRTVQEIDIRKVRCKVCREMQSFFDKVFYKE